MKKMIIIASVAIIGLVLAATTNSWAQRDSVGKRDQDRSGHFQKWNKSANQFYQPNPGRSSAPGIQHHRPAPRPAPKLYRPDHRREPQRFAPKHRNWPHRPYYRPFAPKRHYWWHRHRAFKNRHYGKTEHHYAPEDAFSASAAISNTGFLVSIGVSETH